jgi:hypothetical protein
MNRKEWIGIIAAIILMSALIVGLLATYINTHYANKVQVNITKIEYIPGHVSYTGKSFVNFPSKTRIYFKYDDIEWDDDLEGDKTDKFTVGQITTGTAIYRKEDNSISRVYLDDD